MRESKSERRKLNRNEERLSIVEIAYMFALRIIGLVETLPRKTVSLEIGKGLVRSSTSIAASLEEAQAAFCEEDFLLKLNNALEEARKTNLCLRLIRDSKLVDSTRELQDLFDESVGIKKVLDTIAESFRKKLS